MLITDDQILIRCASKYYNTFKVPTMVMESKKKRRKYTNADKADLDIFCDSDRIGVIVNLSQEINTIMWDMINRDGDWGKAIKAYYDNCLLSILSMIAIDATKREYPLDCNEELQIVRARYDERDEDGRAIRPNFFAHVAKKKGYYNPKKKNYKHQLAPMDFVQEIVNIRKWNKNKIGYEKRREIRFASIGSIINNSFTDRARKGYVDIVLSMVRDVDNKIRTLYQASADVVSPVEKRKLASMYFNHCVEGIKTMNLNNATIRDLLIEMDKPENNDIKRKLWSVIFGSYNRELSTLLIAAKKPIYTIEECKTGELGDLRVFWLQFKYTNVS